MFFLASASVFCARGNSPRASASAFCAANNVARSSSVVSSRGSPYLPAPLFSFPGHSSAFSSSVCVALSSLMKMDLSQCWPLLAPRAARSSSELLVSSSSVSFFSSFGRPSHRPGPRPTVGLLCRDSWPAHALHYPEHLSRALVAFITCILPRTC